MTNAVGDVTIGDDGDLKIMTNNGLQTIMSNAVLTSPASIGAVSSWSANNVVAGAGVGGFNIKVNPDEMLEKYEFNQFVVEHKVQEQELLTLKEQNVNYAEEIKEAMAKNCAREFIKKLSFSKKHDPDTSTHSFRGRVWVFTREELVSLIEDVKQGRV
jgi:hypothetical protein